MNARHLLFPLLFLAASAVRADVDINASNFPDASFRSYLLSLTEGADGVLSDEEIAGLKALFLDGKGISSLAGIQHFTSLRTLRCSQNRLTQLDLSGMATLTSVTVHDGQLASVSVEGCTSLSHIGISRNLLSGKAMDAFVESLPQVEEGRLVAFADEGEQNDMTPLQQAAAKAKGWQVYSTDGLNDHVWEASVSVDEATFPDPNFRNLVVSLYGTKIPADRIKDINALYVEGRNIKSLRGIEYFTSLGTLCCQDNHIAELDLRHNTQLAYLDCHGNLLGGEAMDVLIESLPDRSDAADGVMLALASDGEENRLTHLQVTKAKAKGWTPRCRNGYAWTDYDGIYEDIEINEKNFPDPAFRSYLLAQNYGRDGLLTAQEIPSVTEINVSGRDIASLQGIEHFGALATLDCSSNRISQLRVSLNTALVTLICWGNHLSSIDLSACTRLSVLDISRNRFSESAMERLVGHLPVVEDWQGGTFRAVYGETDWNVITTPLVGTCRLKNWQVQRYETALAEWQDFLGTDPDALSDIKADTAPLHIWHDLSGKALPGMPGQKGIYIQDGRKVFVRQP